jgi:exopolysaccharide production protein ExoZ
LDLIDILKTIFFFPFFDSEKISSPLISVGWSLSYEIYFYLLVSFFLVYKINTLKALLVTICTLCTLGVLINPSIAMLRFLTNPILLEFALGISCGLIYSWLSSSKITNSKKSYISMALMLIGFILMSITFFVSTNNNIHAFDVIENDSHLAFYRSIVWGIPCAVFMLGVILVEKSFMVKIPKILILAGDASYSNYLIHGQVYVIIAIIYRSLHLNSVTYLITVIPICIVVSIIFFKIIERPLNSTVDNLINYKRKA